MSTRKRSQSRHFDGVLVVGGGYAGLHAAKAAADAGTPVTVVDPNGRHEFVTRLAAVAGRVAPRDDAAHDLVAFGHPVVIGTVARLGDGELTLDDGADMTADAVVFCAGAGATQPDIDGIGHALPLRSSDDADAIREALATTSGISIIGGGATGVQLAGAISASHYGAEVRLIEAEARILSTMTPAASEGAARILDDRHVDVRVDAKVERISAEGVVVDGELLGGTVVWAGGFAPRTDGLDVELADDGRIAVDAELRVSGMERTFAAGDVAAHVDGDGDALPMSAQVAVQAGAAAGRNAAKVANDELPDRVTLSHRGWVLDLSGHRGIAEFGGVALAAPFADLVPPLLHELIDLKTLFGMGGVAALTY